MLISKASFFNSLFFDFSFPSTKPVTWDVATAGSGISLSNNDLTVTTTGGASSVRATQGISSGKKYWEVTLGQTTSGSGYQHVGIASMNLLNNQYVGQTAESYAYAAINGNKWNNSINQLYGVLGAANDVIGIAFDADNGTLEFFKNGLSMGIAFTGIPQMTYYPAVSGNNSNSTMTSTVAFKNFVYTPPSGFTAITTAQSNNPSTPSITWDVVTAGSGISLSNNDLTVTTTGGASSVRATKGISSDKKYWEVTLGQTTSGSGYQHIGIASMNLLNNQYVGQIAESYAYAAINSNKWNNSINQLYGVLGVTNDVIGVAFDADNGTLEFFKNGLSMGIAFTGIPKMTYYPAVSGNNSNSTMNSTVAFKNFVYTPPLGFTEI